MIGESKKDPSTGDRRDHAVQHIRSLLFAERSLIQQSLHLDAFYSSGAIRARDIRKRLMLAEKQPKNQV